MKKINKMIAAGLLGLITISTCFMGCQPSVEQHVHTYSDTWSKDTTHHWHSATCGDTDEVKDRAEHGFGAWSGGKKFCTTCGYEVVCQHTFGEWSVTKEATETEGGKKVRLCSVCNFEEEKNTPNLNHEHSWSDKWSKDDTHHWKICSGCSEENESAAHTFGAWSEGKKSCATCGYEVVCQHAFGAWSGGKKSCTTCGYEVVCQHTFGAWSDGKKSCTTCGYEVTCQHTYVDGTCTVCGKCKPNTMVKITGSTNDYYMSNTELTYDKWYQVYQWATSADRGTSKYVFQDLGREGSFGTDGATPTEGSNQPVAYISWRDAVVWCNAASEKEGLTPVYWLEGTTEFTDKTKVLREAENYSQMLSGEYYTWGSNKSNTTNVESGNGKAEKAVINTSANGYRLPTEAEWEYAAKGGKEYTYCGSDKIDEVAWYEGNSGDKTHDVETKKSNAYGMYDMSGNVWEWCQDLYFRSGSPVRVIRGGGFSYSASKCSVSSRLNGVPIRQKEFFGLRLVRSSL